MIGSANLAIFGVLDAVRCYFNGFLEGESANIIILFDVEGSFVTERGNIDELSLREVECHVSFDEIASVFGYKFVCVEVMVEKNSFKFEIPSFQGLKREDSMVDGPEAGVGDQPYREFAGYGVVYGEEVVGDRNHHASGAFDKNNVVAFFEFVACIVNDRKVDFAIVYAGGQLSRCGEAEDDRSGKTKPVFRKLSGAGKGAVGIDILGMASVSGLDEFLSYDVFAFFCEQACEPCRAVFFTGIGVDACDEETFAHDVKWKDILKRGWRLVSEMSDAQFFSPGSLRRAMMKMGR